MAKAIALDYGMKLSVCETVVNAPQKAMNEKLLRVLRDNPTHQEAMLRTVILCEASSTAAEIITDINQILTFELQWLWTIVGSAD